MEVRSLAISELLDILGEIVKSAFVTMEKEI
jgi:hypothetical protein